MCIYLCTYLQVYVYTHECLIVFICLYHIYVHTQICVSPLFISVMFLKQVRTGLQLARAWFLKIISVRTSVCVCVCVCVFVSAQRLLITSSVMWYDIDPMQLVKQDLQLLAI